jgi:hypothetical protein
MVEHRSPIQQPISRGDDDSPDRLILEILHRESIPLAPLRANIWQDEIKDVFLLSKDMEIFPLSKTHLRCYVFSPSIRSEMLQKGWILEEHLTDDDFYTLDINAANLVDILDLCRLFKYRPHLQGPWVTKMVKRLGHSVSPYTPTSLLEQEKRKATSVQLELLAK